MLEFAIASAFITGLVGYLSSLDEDSKAAKKAQDEMDFIDESYRLSKEEAELKFNEAKRQAEKNAKEAELQADITDQSLNVSERGLSNDFNAAIDNMYLGQTNDAWTWNNAAMSAGANTGNAYANLAASGVRAGSSLDDAVLMESATNEAQLQFAQDAKRRSDNNNLAQVLNSLAGQRFDIYQNRVGADITRSNALDLRQSYAEGGYNYNLYQNQIEQLETQRKYKYNAAEEEKNEHSGWKSILRAFGAAFGLGSKGLSTGYNVATTWDNAKKPNYNVTVGGN